MCVYLKDIIKTSLARRYKMNLKSKIANLESFIKNIQKMIKIFFNLFTDVFKTFV